MVKPKFTRKQRIILFGGEKEFEDFAIDAKKEDLFNAVGLLRGALDVSRKKKFKNKKRREIVLKKFRRV